MAARPREATKRNPIVSEEKPAGFDPDKTLATLDQLSQTINVMAEVVERLRRHLNRQLQLQQQDPLADKPQKQPGPAQHPNRVLH